MLRCPVDITDKHYGLGEMTIDEICHFIMFKMGENETYVINNNHTKFRQIEQRLGRLARRYHKQKLQGKTTWRLEFKCSGRGYKESTIKRLNTTYEMNLEYVKEAMEGQSFTDEQIEKIERHEEHRQRMAELKAQEEKPKREYTKKDAGYWEEDIKYSKGKRGRYKPRRLI